MSVGRICTREVFLAEKADSVREVARRMITERVGALVVVDEDRRPAGIVTDRDVMAHCVANGRPPHTTRVSAIMTAPAVTLGEAAPIEDALRLMADHDVRRLVVVDGNGRLAGVLALDDVLQLFAEEFASIGRIASRPVGH